LAGTYAPICAEAAPITLSGTPAGGVFSGPGVTGNTFNPATAGAGTHTIIYTYTAATGCSQTNSTSITVHPRPTSTFTLTDNSICVNETSTLQSTGTVATGNIATWTWNLGDGNPPQSYTNANPLTIAYPTHNSYTISLVTLSDMGCGSTVTTQTIGVHPLPTAGFVLPPGICMPQGNAVFNNSTTVADNSTLSYVWNFGDPGSGANNTSSATNPSHTYAVVNNYPVTLTATSAFGCVDQDMHYARVIQIHSLIKVLIPMVQRLPIAGILVITVRSLRQLTRLKPLQRLVTIRSR
jgi:PKD repeat protein